MAALEGVHCYFTVAYLWFTFFSDYYSLYLLLRLLGDPLEEFYSWLSLVLQYSTSSINATTFVNQGSIYYCLIQLQAVPGSRSVWTSECRKGVASSNLERALSERKTAGRVPSPPFFYVFLDPFPRPHHLGVWNRLVQLQQMMYTEKNVCLITAGKNQER